MSSTPQSCIEALIDLGFTRLEAEVYSALLRESPTTGYRAAQMIGKPAANVYKAVESLQGKGAVIVDEGSSRLCRAVPPDELLAHLGRSFTERSRRAARELARSRRSQTDDRVYHIRSRDQVLERCRQMLARGKQIALIDAFPEPLEELRSAIEAAVARGLDLAVKVYDDITIKGADVIRAPRGSAVIQRWPGQWINIVVDGREHLLAFLSSEGSDVLQAVWSGSAYLSWIYHSALSSELLLAALEDGLDRGIAVEKLRRLVTKYERLRALQAPGYRELMKRFGGSRRADGRSGAKE